MLHLIPYSFLLYFFTPFVTVVMLYFIMTRTYFVYFIQMTFVIVFSRGYILPNQGLYSKLYTVAVFDICNTLALESSTDPSSHECRC